WGGDARADQLYSIQTTYPDDGSSEFSEQEVFRPVRVAILGDSYISGEGAKADPSSSTADPSSSYLPGTDAWETSNNVDYATNMCHRSEDSWAVQIAENDLGLTLDSDDLFFGACSGAVTADVMLRPQDSCARSGCLPQIAALKNWMATTGKPD